MHDDGRWSALQAIEPDPPAIQSFGDIEGQSSQFPSTIPRRPHQGTILSCHRRSPSLLPIVRRRASVSPANRGASFSSVQLPADLGVELICPLFGYSLIAVPDLLDFPHSLPADCGAQSINPNPDLYHHGYRTIPLLTSDHGARSYDPNPDERQYGHHANWLPADRVAS